MAENQREAQPVERGDLNLNHSEHHSGWDSNGRVKSAQSPYRVAFKGGQFRVIDSTTNMIVCEINRRDRGADIDISLCVSLPRAGTLFVATPDHWIAGGLFGSGNRFFGGPHVGISINGQGGYYSLQVSPLINPQQLDVVKRHLDRQVRLRSAQTNPVGVQNAICQVSGTYQSSGCEHFKEIEAMQGDSFPACPTCGTDITWTFSTEEENEVEA